MGKAAVATPGPRWPWLVLTVAVLVAVGAVGWAVSREPERVEVVVDEPDPELEAEIAAMEEGVAERDREIVALMGRVADLETRLEGARGAMGADPPRPAAALRECREELGRVNAGLERAIEELNSRRVTIAGTGGAPALPRASVGRVDPGGAVSGDAEESTKPQPYRKVRSYSERVRIAGETATVTGRLYNPDERDQEVRVELALLRDNRVVTRDTQTVLVPGKGHLTVTAQLHAGTITGTYGARVRPLE